MLDYYHKLTESKRGTMMFVVLQTVKENASNIIILAAVISMLAIMIRWGG